MKRFLIFSVVFASLAIQAATIKGKIPAMSGFLSTGELTLEKAEILLECTLENGLTSETDSVLLDSDFQRDAWMAGGYMYRVSTRPGAKDFSLIFANRGSCSYVLHAEASDKNGKVHRTNSLGLTIETTDSMNLNELQTFMNSNGFAEKIKKNFQPFKIEVGPIGDLWEKR